MSKASSLAVRLLSATSTFDQASLLVLEALTSQTDRRLLKRGDVLVREGDPSESFFVVLSGRFTVHYQDLLVPIAEIAQGELIGEIGFFARLPRTATVVATRDSIVVEFDRENFESVADRLPSLREAVITSLARRFAERRSRPAPPKTLAKVRTLAILPAGESGICLAFLQLLRQALHRYSRAIVITQRDLEAKLCDLPVHEQAAFNWLNGLEAKADLVVYIADTELDPWTHICIRQADAILLVARATCSPHLNPSEKLALSLHPASARRLVLIHPVRSAVASGTAAWLDRRQVQNHHHVALEDSSDVDRLARFLTGKALGLVAGGGGSLGSAHLGVYKALAEAGVRFDYVGGTSVGAAMMAGVALGADAEQVDRGTHNIFIRSRAFRRLTVPRYSLLDHKAFDRALWAEYGDAVIEDLWLPFFALSTNLSTNRPFVHRRGKLWHAVRASGSIPGFLPPFFTTDGEMLVDGAIMNNLPLEQMKELKSGPNVAVELAPRKSRKYTVDYDHIPGATEALATMLNPFARTQPLPIPNILQVIAKSMLAHQPSDPAIGEEDVLICPQLPSDLSFMDWSRHTELFLDVYDHTVRWIEEQRREGHPGVRAVLGIER